MVTTSTISTPHGDEKSTCEPKEVPVLRSQPGAPIDLELIGHMRPTAIETPLEEMRRRFREDGYIFVKGLLPREDVLDVREHYFTHLMSTGILKQGTSPREGMYNPAGNPMDHTGIGAPVLSDNGLLQDKIVAAHVTEGYLSFLQHPALRSFVRSFMQWKNDVLLSRTLLRHTVPGSESTGVHYDQIFLRGGDPHDEFLTAWVPIGDIAVNGGGLIYLEDSTSLGRSIEDDFTALAEKNLLTPEQTISAFNANMMAGGVLSRDAQEFAITHASGKKWLTAQYIAGDVVFHNPYILHAAAMNEDPEGRIRLSTDLRFYEEGMRLDKRWMKVFTISDGL